MEKNATGHFHDSMLFFLFLIDRFLVITTHKNHLRIVWGKNHLIKLMALVLGCFNGILYESGKILTCGGEGVVFKSWDKD